MDQLNERDAETGVTLREDRTRSADGTITGQIYVVTSPDNGDVFRDGAKYSREKALRAYESEISRIRAKRK